MKQFRTTFFLLVFVGLFCLMISGADAGVKFGGLKRAVLKPPNDTCKDAEEIERVMITSKTGGGEVVNRKFWHSGGLDDWYSYTAGQYPPGDYRGYALEVRVTSDKPQVEFEIYDNCFSQPLAHSMAQMITIFNDGAHITHIFRLSGLDKLLEVNWVENQTYLIHVNWIYPPDGGGPITYDVVIREILLEHVR